MKRWVRIQVASLATSAGFRSLMRGRAALQRRLSGKEAVVHYFHQVDDPYSDLAVNALPHLQRHYRIRVQPHLVPAPDAGAAPEPERLARWSLSDAGVLAQALGLPAPWQQPPEPSIIEAAQSRLAGIRDPIEFAGVAAAIREAFSAGSLAPGPDVAGDTAAELQAGESLRKRLGHYLGATFHFEGEWYWGLDRLHYLEQRLQSLARDGGAVTPFVARKEITLDTSGIPAETLQSRRPVLHMYLSLRSPYTWLAMPRVVALAETWNAELKLRFVLPMVMRGMALPVAKRFYIVMDTKREAERLGLPFGHIADPVGKPAERGLAVLHHAINAGKGPEFALSFLRGVFAEGISAYTDKGLLKLCQRAGISEDAMHAALADESWREVAAANREELFAAGLWGVPSFRVDDGSLVWGQDRLWRVEGMLRDAHER